MSSMSIEWFKFISHTNVNLSYFQDCQNKKQIFTQISWELVDIMTQYDLKFVF